MYNSKKVKKKNLLISAISDILLFIMFNTVCFCDNIIQYFSSLNYLRINIDSDKNKLIEIDNKK